MHIHIVALGLSLCITLGFLYGFSSLEHLLVILERA